MIRYAKPTKFSPPKGLKPVKPPSNPARRQAQREPDVPTTGGCHSTRSPATR